MSRIPAPVTSIPIPHLNRRTLMAGALGTAASLGLSLALAGPALAAQSPAFAHWVAAFRARAVKRGISEATYNRVMNAVTPDTSVYALQRSQPEFTEQMWQYINRRCSDWRVITGKERAKEYAGVLARVEKDYGVDRYTLLGLWGMESSFGDVIDQPEIHAAGDPGAGGAGLRRAAPAQLLGSRTARTR